MPLPILGGVLAQAPAQQPGGGFFGFLPPMILVFVIFYFLVIRPQQKQAKKHQEFLNGLKVGDEVITNSGIFGKIEDVDERSVRLEIARDVRIRILKSQIAGPQPGAPESTGKK